MSPLLLDFASKDNHARPISEMNFTYREIPDANNMSPTLFITTKIVGMSQFNGLHKSIGTPCLQVKTRTGQTSSGRLRQSRVEGIAKIIYWCEHNSYFRHAAPCRCGGLSLRGGGSGLHGLSRLSRLTGKRMGT